MTRSADILAHAYAQCRSNKGAPGVDGQDFADIEAYGVSRWLGELALALREESYQPDPIGRVWQSDLPSYRDRVFALATRLPESDFLSWGWRIPFLASALLIIVGS